MRFASLVFLALLWSASVAQAHGRPPFLGDIAFHPTDPDVIVVRGTWGLVVSEDGGETWGWSCAAVTGADPTREDPPILVTPSGAVLLGTFGGLARSSSNRCEYERPAELDGQFIIDLYARPAEPGVIWAVATSGVDPDAIWRSDDEGATWSMVGDPIDDILVERVRAAPTDASRVYLSGAIPVMTIRYDGGVPDGGPATTERTGWFLRSDDGGQTYTRIEMPLLEGERNVHLLAVDPTDADRVLVRMTKRSIDPTEERVLLTEDAGETWTTVANARFISGAAFSDDGERAWVTSRIVDGLFRSTDGARSFTQVQRLSLPCVEARGDEVWVCVDELADGYALGRSSDGGDTLEPVLEFSDLYDLIPCSRCTAVGFVCPMWRPDLLYDLRLDGGSNVLPDGGITGAPRDAGMCLEDGMDAGPGTAPMDGGLDGGTTGDPPGDGCGCRAGGGASPSPAGFLALLALLWARRRG